MNSLPEQTVPDLMFFESQGAEQYRDDAQMHHFLDTNLYRARPRVSYHLDILKRSKAISSSRQLFIFAVRMKQQVLVKQIIVLKNHIIIVIIYTSHQDWIRNKSMDVSLVKQVVVV